MDSSILFAARANIDKEPRAMKVITDLRAKGLTDRQILSTLADHYEGYDTRDNMQIAMTGAVMRRYVMEAVSSALSELIPGMIESALENIHVIQTAPAAPQEGTGQVAPSVQRLIGSVLTNPDDDEEDYSQW
jgi:hypothetical protein